MSANIKRRNSTFNPFGSKYASYRPEKTVADRLTSWKRTLLAVLVIVLVAILVGVPSILHSLRSSATDSIDKVNNTLATVRQAAGSSEVHDVAKRVYDQSKDDNVKAALNPIINISGSDTLPEAKIDQNASNTDAGMSVAPYFILCDIANSGAVGLTDTTMGTVCSSLKDQTVDMLSKVKRYNSMQKSIVGKFVPGSDPLPDVSSN